MAIKILSGGGTGGVSGGKVALNGNANMFVDGAGNPTSVAANQLTGILPNASGGTGADTSATGGANQFLKQLTVGGAFSLGYLTPADMVAVTQKALDLSAVGYFDDFLIPQPSAAGVYFGPAGLRSFVQNSGTVSYTALSGRPGIHSLKTATTSTTGGSAYNAEDATYNTVGTSITTWTFRIPTFATVGDDGLFWVGISDVFGFNELTTGNTCAIGVDRVTDASHFTILSTAAGTVKVRTASTTSAVAGTWYTAMIITNPTGIVNYYIAPVGGPFAELSNSPISAANSPTNTHPVGPWAEVIKSAGTGTSLILDLDQSTYLYSGFGSR